VGPIIAQRYRPATYCFPLPEGLPESGRAMRPNTRRKRPGRFAGGAAGASGIGTANAKPGATRRGSGSASIATGGSTVGLSAFLSIGASGGVTDGAGSDF